MNADFLLQVISDEIFLTLICLAILLAFISFIVKKSATLSRSTPCGELVGTDRTVTLVGVIQSSTPAISRLTGEPCLYSLVRSIEASVDSVESMAVAAGASFSFRKSFEKERERMNAGIREFVPDWALDAHFLDETGRIALDFAEAHVLNPQQREINDAGEIKAVLKKIAGASASEHMLDGNRIIEDYLPLDAEIALTGRCIDNPDPMAYEPRVFQVHDIEPATPKLSQSRWFRLTLTALSLLFVALAFLRAIELREVGAVDAIEDARSNPIPAPTPLIRR